MPRKPRFYLPNIPVHIVQRGNNRQAVFFSEEDYMVYLNWMFEGAERHGCLIHAYVLMTNHVHVLLTPLSEQSISLLMQFVGRHYVTYINHEYQRSGTLWEGRHKGSVIDSGRYALACSRYIEMNPVRAGMVNTPGEYRWSSYRANAYGENKSRLTALQEYLRLGGKDDERMIAYRNLFKNQLEAEALHAIRSCVQTGTPLGDDRFTKEIETMLGRKVGYNKRGRPMVPKGGVNEI